MSTQRYKAFGTLEEGPYLEKLPVDEDPYPEDETCNGITHIDIRGYGDGSRDAFVEVIAMTAERAKGAWQKVIGNITPEVWFEV